MMTPYKLIYVCSPFRGNLTEMIRNSNNTAAYCASIAKEGAVPIAPHLYFPRFMNEDIPEEREFGMEVGKALLEICDEIWVFGDRISEGMQEEINLAKELNIPIKHQKEREFLK